MDRLKKNPVVLAFPMPETDVIVDKETDFLRVKEEDIILYHASNDCRRSPLVGQMAYHAEDENMSIRRRIARVYRDVKRGIDFIFCENNKTSYSIDLDHTPSPDSSLFLARHLHEARFDKFCKKENITSTEQYQAKAAEYLVHHPFLSIGTRRVKCPNEISVPRDANVLKNMIRSVLEEVLADDTTRVERLMNAMRVKSVPLDAASSNQSNKLLDQSSSDPYFSQIEHISTGLYWKSMYLHSRIETLTNNRLMTIGERIMAKMDRDEIAYLAMLGIIKHSN